ncbi:MAG: AAA family ATPase [Planctomycetota bacterium]|nr:AAA family ATPase [Planctomycetota bacterium]
MGEQWQELVATLNTQVFERLKRTFIGKSEIVDLLGVSLVAGENLFILGPPGTAKSALVNELARLIEGKSFEYLLTRFTEPNELFGPFDISKLREGELITNTEGMLPEASLVFLDELLNANSAILNGLLMVLNERVFRRGKERWKLPTLMVVGASNHLPQDDALQALFDRFLLRVHCDNVPEEQLTDVLEAGWRHELKLTQRQQAKTVSVDDIRILQSQLSNLDFSKVRAEYSALVRRLRYAGISVSDRRAVKLQRLIGASAILSGRLTVELSDLWVLRYIWDAEEEQEVLAGIVNEVTQKHSTTPGAHPRSRSTERVDEEALARDLDILKKQLSRSSIPEADLSYLKDRIGILAARCEWIVDETQRHTMRSGVQGLWQLVGEAP